MVIVSTRWGRRVYSRQAVLDVAATDSGAPKERLDDLEELLVAPR